MILESLLINLAIFALAFSVWPLIVWTHRKQAEKRFNETMARRFLADEKGEGVSMKKG